MTNPVYEYAGVYGPQAILSAAGVPQVNLPVSVYQYNTTTPIDLFTDWTMSTPVTSLQTDNLGNLLFFSYPGYYTISFTLSGTPTTDNVLVMPWWSDGGIPAGTIFQNGATAPPVGWFNCDGSAVSRTSYAALFNAIGTTYGAGDGSTTFNLPDGRGRVLVGAGGPGGNTQPTFVLNQSGGEEDHTLIVAELAPHGHTIGNDSGATNFYVQPTAGTTSAIIDAANYGQPGSLIVSEGNTTDNTGSGSPHNNMQPFLAVNHIIKA